MVLRETPSNEAACSSETLRPTLLSTSFGVAWVGAMMSSDTNW
jgi:hypothetical protein